MIWRVFKQAIPCKLSYFSTLSEHDRWPRISQDALAKLVSIKIGLESVGGLLDDMRGMYLTIGPSVDLEGQLIKVSLYKAEPRLFFFPCRKDASCSP